MGIYTKYVLPRLLDLAMRNKDSTHLRKQWLNLPFYSPDVHHIYGIDTSLELQRMAATRAANTRARVEFLCQSAEEPLPLADETIDTVVMTWTLCSIPNPANALQQMKRVLRRSGRLVFIEHGRSPDTRTAAWQDRMTPVWKRIGGGCHLNRKIDELITAAAKHR